MFGMAKKIKNPMKVHRAVDWAKTIKRSARFCIQPRRFLPFFITDVLVITVAFLLFGNAAIAYGGLAVESLPPEAVSVVGVIMTLFIAWALASLWIMGAVIHQSSKPKELERSWIVSIRRYPDLLAVMIVVFVIKFLLAAVPQIGLLLACIASMAFLLASQFVIVGGLGFQKALSNSIKALRYKFPAIFHAWLIGGLLTLAIMAIFSLPLVSTLFYFVAQHGYEDAILYMMVSLDWNVIYIEAGILLLGFSVARTFLLHFLTDVYTQLNKKRFFIF
jgi:hypothetical protein